MTRRRTGTPSRLADDGGAVALLTALLMVVFMGMAAIAVDVAREFAVAAQLQKAADAGSLAGVVFMPSDFATATSTATQVTRANFKNSTGGVTVSVTHGQNPTQLTVTATATVQFAFGAAIGIGQATVSRSSTSDFAQPVPLGSPCNIFGNEPMPGVGFTPGSTQVASGNCAGANGSTPHLWANIAGPATPKHNGDQFNTRWCAQSGYNCDATPSATPPTWATGDNLDFSSPLDQSHSGNVFTIKTSSAATPGESITVQIFDPVYVDSGNACENLPTFASASPNPHVTDATGTNGRYNKGTTAAGGGDFCPGDYRVNIANVPPATSFAIRNPTSSNNPLDGAQISGCTKQFPGDDGTNLVAKLTTGGSYSDYLGATFHQWYTLCTLTNVQPSTTYYLQVRTDLPLAGPAASPYAGAPYSNSGLSTGMDRRTDQGAQTSGHNRYSLRAVVTGGSSNDVSIGGYSWMDIYQNQGNSVSTFYLARVGSDAAGHNLQLGFFDVGDASGSGTITILPPSDSSYTDTHASPIALSNCTGGFANSAVSESLPTCSKGIDGSFNGLQYNITVPLPKTYTCSDSAPAGCWFRVQFSYAGAIPSDTTTWSAGVDGDPVRIVR